MRNYEAVYAAWDGELLVGLVCAMDDGSMTAYVHYLLVRPAYHGRGIGKALVQKVKDRYADYLRIVVVAYDDELGFYERCGFTRATGASPMFITDLWT
jgi:GNAT superfamily N-acetyltransferase